MSRKNVEIEKYIQEIDNWLPYPKIRKTRYIDNVREEVLEAIQDMDNPDPIIAYGDPYQVAKGLGLSQDWGTTKSGWLIRIFAFIIDSILIVSICLAYLLFGLVVIFRIELEQLLKISELSEVLELLQINLEPQTFPINAILSLIYMLGAVVIYSAYYIVLEKFYSATIGKIILGLQVVDRSGIKLTWKQSLVRNFTKLPGIVEFLVFDILLGMLMVEKRKGENQKATDILADTIVVRKNKDLEVLKDE